MLGEDFGPDDFGEEPVVVGVVDGFGDVAGDDDVHLVHDPGDVFAEVVGHKRDELAQFPDQDVVTRHVSGFEKGRDPGREVGREALLGNEAHGLAERVLGNDIGGEAVEGFFDLERTFTGAAEDLVDGQVGKVENLALELEYLGAREETGEGALSKTVKFMVDRREARHGDWANGARVELVVPLVPNPAGAGVNLVEEIGVVAVKLIGIDPNNGACR